MLKYGVRLYLQNFKRRWITTVVVAFLSLLLFYMATMIVFVEQRHMELSSVYSKNDNYFTNLEMEDIYNHFGEDNITRVNSYYFGSSYVVHTIDGNFLNNGVLTRDSAVPLELVEHVKLLYGNTFSSDTTQPVVVIDEDTAMNEFGTLDVVGRTLNFEYKDWTIVGVVTNTSRRASYADVEHMWIEVSRTDVYVPYYFVDTFRFYGSAGVETIIINTDALYANEHVGDKVQNYLDELLGRVGTSYTVSVAKNLSFYSIPNTSYLFAVFVGEALLLLLLLLPTRKEWNSVQIRKYNDEDYEHLMELKVLEKQQNFMRPTTDIIALHKANVEITDLYVISWENKDVGLCLVKRSDTEKNAFIWDLFIHWFYQHKGVGSRAIYKIIKDVRKRYDYTITTTTSIGNKDAQRFFTRHNFKLYSSENGELNYYYKQYKIDPSWIDNIYQ